MVDNYTLQTWAQPPSRTEEEKCRNAVNRITAKLNDHFGSDIEIFLQGSYKNRTNVRKDSDVDIVVRHNKYFIPDLGELSPQDKQIYNSNRVPASYTFSQFKDDVQRLLEDEFDYGEVERKNKCIRVDGNSYRVNADVVPVYEHRRFATPTRVKAIGVGLFPEEGSYTHSFPKQHFDSGSDKNQRTGGSYKGAVRILKNVRNLLIDEGIITSDLMPSFLLECSIWNLDDYHFQLTNHRSLMQSVIREVWNDMQQYQKHNEYAEVSDLKWLFRGSKWEPEQVKTFMDHSWKYLDL